jgi:ribose 5-phosphate isomerase B
MEFGMNQSVAIGSDHAGFALKESLVETLAQLGYETIDLGTDSVDSVDYPDFAHAVAAALGAGKADKGVLICGSGIGISMAANRHPDVRAALVHDALGARMCRQHNDANVIVFGGRMIGIEVARDCLDVFLNTEFEGGRHQRRIDKITPD